jgi:hypothetical protein
MFGSGMREVGMMSGEKLVGEDNVSESVEVAHAAPIGVTET